MDSNSSPTKIWVTFFLISGSRSDLIYLLSFLEFSNMPMFLISQMNCHDPYFEFDDFSNLDELEEEEGEEEEEEEGGGERRGKVCNTS
jgi:hypothetical protein